MFKADSITKDQKSTLSESVFISGAPRRGTTWL